MTDNAALRTLIRARLRARVEAEKKQGQLLDNLDDFAETIRVKLSGLLETNSFWNFSRCGREEIYKTCENCGDLQKIPYRCNLKWCPRCQQRIGRIRRNLISLWARRIKQPKHLVLTHRNFSVLTRKSIRSHTRSLAKMRRAKCFSDVRGGCCSTEITHEGRGWHVHAHLLLDVRWLDMKQVSIAWGKLVGQDFAIVKVKDVRDKEYLQEICKYVVEGSELAKWEPNLINQFVQAIRGLRMFNSFGTLRECAPEIRRELFAMKPQAEPCQCGCEKFHYETEEHALIHEIGQMEKRSSSRKNHASKPAAAAAAAGRTASTPQLL